MLHKKKIKIVIVEDDKYYNQMLSRYVKNICNNSVQKNFDCEIQSYYNAHECIEELDDDTDFMILDYFLENKEEDDVLSAEDVIKEAKIHCPDCKIIVVSAMRNAHKAAELMKSGIYEYVDKNVNTTNRIGSLLQKALYQEVA
ncbi:MAG: hypothetical protein WDZ35_05610 [Crocinitomicaceae bacterium]